MSHSQFRRIVAYTETCVASSAVRRVPAAFRSGLSQAKGRVKAMDV